MQTINHRQPHNGKVEVKNEIESGLIKLIDKTWLTYGF